MALIARERYLTADVDVARVSSQQMLCGAGSCPLQDAYLLTKE